MVDYKKITVEKFLQDNKIDGKQKIKNADHFKTIKNYFSIRKEVDGVTYNTLATDMNALTHLSDFLKDKKFSQATKEDLRSYIQYLKNSVGLSDESANFYGTRIKRFYKYVSNPKIYENGRQEQKNIEYPDCVKWISTSIYDKNEMPLENLLSDDQIAKMLEVSNIREQALIVTLLDGGLREGEAMSLKVKSVDFEKKLGAFWILPKKRGKSNGSLKTGSRRVQSFLIPSTTAIMKEYLNNYHKFRNNPDAPLFYSEKPGSLGNPLTAKGLYLLIVNVCKLAGIKDHIHPHILRHNSATRCVKAGFNENELRTRFGWSRSSTMPSRYVHLADEDLTEKIYKLKGLKKDEIVKSEKLSPWICPNCQHENIPSNIVCGRCGLKHNITKEDLGIDATTTGIATQEMLKSLGLKDKDAFIDLLADAIEKRIKSKEK